MPNPARPSLDTVQTQERQQRLRSAPESDRALLYSVWDSPRGFWNWFAPVTHKTIGTRFIVTAIVFLLLGGVQALLMRLQLAAPGNSLIGPDLYRQLVTMHGTTMMFLFAVPIMEGFGMYMVPLMVGTRDMAFPRMGAFGYYVYLIAGVVLYGAMFVGLAPDAGWFNYVPLAGPDYSPGMRIDFYATVITFLEISALIGAVEIIVTIFKQRAPGMSLNRMPLFVWSQLVMSFMIVFAMPPLMVTSLYLAFDRLVGTHFFNPPRGGDALLWQHLFWFFGHPEVYIIFVPALGFVSTILIAHTQRRIFGYTAIVLSLAATGFIGFGLWVHHMFASGIPLMGSSFFNAASMMVAIPTGVQFFCWIATLWGSRPRLTVPLLFVLGFFPIFLIGGLTGVMVGSVPFNLQTHDTHFIVAHLHYVLIGGAVFPLFGAIYHWFPKLSGRMMDHRVGVWSFALMFLGFNLTFFPLHNLGFLGMTRRIYTYLDGLGWEGLNLLATVGAFLLALGMVLTLANAAAAAVRGTAAPANPWNAATLEWLAESPPPPYNFQYIPVAEGRYPLWDGDPADPAVVVGLNSHRREVLNTTLLDAEPESRSVLPDSSFMPALLALSVGVGFIGLMFDFWWIFVSLGAVFVVLAVWHWPRKHERTPPWRLKEGEDASGA